MIKLYGIAYIDGKKLIIGDRHRLINCQQVIKRR